MPDSPHARRYASVEDAADYVGLSIRTVKRMVRRGELKAYRYGNNVLRVDLNDVDLLLDPTAGDDAELA